MPFLRVQAAPPQNGTGSINLTFPSLPAIGNVIGIEMGGNLGPAFALSDNQGGANTYVPLVTSPTRSGYKSSLWLCLVAASAGTFTITVSDGGVGGGVWGGAQEFSGFGAIAPLAFVASQTGALNNHAVSGTTPPTSETRAVVLAAISIANVSAAPVVEAGWTEEFDYGNFHGEGDTQIDVSGAGAKECSWTLTGGAGYVACIAALVSGVVKSQLRGTQFVQTISVEPDPSPIRGSQIVQGLSATGVKAVRATQVIRTLLVSSDVPPPAGEGQIMKLDTPDLDDVGTPYQAFVVTRAEPPSGSIDKLGEVRDAMLIAGAQSGVTLEVEVNKNLGFDLQSSQVSLTPDAAETRVMKKCEGIAVADARVVQFKIGDASLAATTWDLDHFRVPQIDENE
jgi:hypothetical protein